MVNTEVARLSAIKWRIGDFIPSKHVLSIRRIARFFLRSSWLMRNLSNAAGPSGGQRVERRWQRPVALEGYGALIRHSRTQIKQRGPKAAGFAFADEVSRRAAFKFLHLGKQPRADFLRFHQLLEFVVNTLNLPQLCR